MSNAFDVDAQTREDAGKGASRRLRRTGMVPGVLYGGDKDPQLIAVNHNELTQHLENEAFYSHVLDLNLAGNSEKVVLKDLQRHPAKPFLTHVDFQRISEAVKIRMHVPLHFINEDVCPGIKKGGIVTRNINEAEVICLPKDLPEFITIDMSHVDMGQSVHLGEMILPAGVELSHTLDLNAPVVSIHGARGMEEEVEEGEELIEGEGEVEGEGEGEGEGEI